MSREYEETIPLSVIEADAEGEMFIEFKYWPGEAPSGLSGPPEHADPGSAAEFEITSSAYVIGKKHIAMGLADHEREMILEYLREQWEEPDPADDEADYRYELWRDEQMEKDND